MSDAQVRVSAALAGRYDIERELGAGGMATVYLGLDLKHHRRVAIKVLRPELAASLGPDRFLREIDVVAGLHHPHILPLYDSGDAGGFLYYVMPLVEGESLRSRLNREKQLPIEDALRIAAEVADALSYAHSRGVVHRDIKPENILLESDHALLTDFGIARAVSEAGGDRLTETGMAVGTPAYMSPEQAGGDRNIDGRSDLYSLACVVYEMLAGRPPFTGPTIESLVRQHVVSPPPPIIQFRPAVSSEVADALARALAKAPADRFNPVGQFAVALGAGTPGRPGLRSSEAAERRELTRQAGKPATKAILGGLLLIAVAAVAWVMLRRRAGGGPAPARSVAVMSFKNIGSDSSDEYFSEGMSEELITALSKVEGLKVAARTSAFSFQQRNVGVRDIGNQLGVGTILEGTVRRAGNRLRITARLVNTEDGFEIWSDQYEREAKDVFAVQDEITRAIVGALRVHLAPATTANLARRSTVSPEAHDLYLQGRFFYEKRDEAGLRRAEQLFQQAIARDSTYAQAYAGLADTYSFIGGFGYAEPRVMFPMAKAAVARALALDSTLVEAHTSLAFIHLFYDWDWPASETEFQRALALDSTYSLAIIFHSWYYVAVGRLDDALHEINRARAIDPLSPIINLRVATMLHWQRRYPEALAQLRRVLDLDSTNSLAHGQLIRTLVQLHRCDAIRGEMAGERWRNSLVTHDGAGAGYALAVCGQRAEARKLVDSLTAHAGRAYISAESIALTYAGLNEKDSTFGWLERAVKDRVWSMYLLKVEPMLDGVRGDPRFAKLVREVGLP